MLPLFSRWQSLVRQRTGLDLAVVYFSVAVIYESAVMPILNSTI